MCVNACVIYTRSIIPTENLDFRPERGEKSGSARDSASFPLFSRFLDFLPVWPRLNYRKPCFGCHGRIPISRRVARVAGTPYGVSRILYEFLSWNDSFICLSSIPSPPPPPPLPLPPLRPLSRLYLARLFHLSFVHPFLSAESLSISLFASLFIRPNPKPGEPSVGSWTAGLAGRQSQLRSWLKVGARTKYAPVIRLEYKPYALFLPPFFFVAPKTRRCGIVFRVSANSFEIASRADAAFARAGARGFISRTFHCNFKKEGEGALGIVPSDMALLNFSLSGKQSRINAMD